MRVTVCQLPHEARSLAVAWDALRQHTHRHSSELVLLPEFAMVEPIWETEHFDAERWAAAEAVCKARLQRLPELDAAFVVGTRPATADGRQFNEGYICSPVGGVTPLRRKYFLPCEEGNWEAHWFDRGDAEFPEFRAGALAFGLNICTELWALETYAAYASWGTQAILTPRATAASTTSKWLAAGVVAAVRSGAFSLSSNRVDQSGNGGGAGWIISPDGEILAMTSAAAPFATVNIDLRRSTRARETYPRYVLARRQQRELVHRELA